MPLRFELRENQDAAGIAPLWQALEPRADPPMFLGWAWMRAWLAETGLHPALLVGWADEAVVLLALLVPGTRRLIPLLPVHGLHLNNTGHDDQDIITVEYNGFVVDRAWAGRAEAAAIGFLLGGKRCDELHLRNSFAAPDTPLFPAEALPPGVTMRELFRKPSWHVDLDALRTEGRGYLDSLSSNTRQQIRRSMRHYERRGPLSLLRARDPAEAIGFLDELKVLHQRYWIGRGEPGAFAYPFFEAFQRRLIETGLAEGAVELVRVSCGEQAIGYVYNLVRNGRVLAYQTGIAFEDDARLKPGLISHALCIQLHLDEGAHVYDFMAGAARYKQSMGQPGSDMLYVTLERPTLALRLERGLRRLWRGRKEGFFF